MIERSPAKINAFLKITGKRGDYHEMISRFIRHPNLYDTIRIKEHTHAKDFDLVGSFGCELQQNSVYKAFLELKKVYSNPEKIERFFRAHTVTIDKNIPQFSGMGGGSSNAATFLKMANRLLKLGLSDHFLAIIGANIGADVPFFVYGYESANVEGIGEIVTPFEEAPLSFHTYTPEDIACDTAKVFQNYSQKFYHTITEQEKHYFKNLPSHDALNTLDMERANDLFVAAADLYPKLHNFNRKGLFFSGSGSTFFSKDPIHG